MAQDLTYDQLRQKMRQMEDATELQQVQEGGQTFWRDVNQATGEKGGYGLGGISIDEYERAGMRPLANANPTLKTDIPYLYDPKSFNLGNFGVGRDISGQMQNIQGSRAAQAINNILGGSAPSLAQIQLQQGMDATRSQAASMANSSRDPLAFRQAMQSAEKANLAQNQQSSLLRAQETLNAINAQQNQNQSLNQLVELGLRERMADQSGAIDLQRLQAEELRQRRIAELGVPPDNFARDATIAGIGALGTLGAGAAMSDIAYKQDIEDGSEEVDQFLDNLKAYKYKYKHSPDRDQVSIMAQDLEKSNLGKKLIFDSGNGKMVNYGKSGPQVFAAMARLNEKIKKLEKSKGKK